MTSGATFDLDTHLMLLVQRDDTASFGILLQKHRNVVVQYLSRMVQNHAHDERSGVAADPFRGLRRGASIPIRRSQGEVRPEVPRLIHRPGERRAGKQPRAVGAQHGKGLRDPVRPVRVE